MSDTPTLRRYLPDYVVEDIRGVSLQSSPNTQLKYSLEQKKWDKESFCWIEIPLTLILCWETIWTRSASFESLVKLLTSSLPGCGFSIKEDAHRVEERLRTKCSATAARFKSCAGRKKKELITSETYKMNILVEEVRSVRKLDDEMKEAIKQKEDLEEETKKTYEELLEEVKQSKIREEGLSSANESLRHYVKKLERRDENEKNKKDLSTLSPTTRWRYMQQLKTRAQKALWFMSSFELQLKSLQVENNDGVRHHIDLKAVTDTNAQLSPTTDGTQGDKYSSLPEEEKVKVEKVLFLMDKFGVSEDFFHQLTMIFHELPRSYLVRQCKYDLNTMCHLTRTPGRTPGVQCSFKELLREQIQDLVSRRILKIINPL